MQSLNCSNSPTFLPIKVPKITTMTMLISIIQYNTLTALFHTPRAIPRTSCVSAHSVWTSTYYHSYFTGVETEAPRRTGSSFHSWWPGFELRQPGWRGHAWNRFITTASKLRSHFLPDSKFVSHLPLIIKFSSNPLGWHSRPHTTCLQSPFLASFP